MSAFQCVFVIWGDKYPTSDVNALVRGVQSHTASPVRFICLSDRPRPDLAAGVELQMIGPDFAQPQFMRGGAQAKLAMFQKGRLTPGVPAVFFDLDTMIMGDVARLAALAAPGRMHMMPATWDRLWPLGRMLNRRRPGSVRTRGNGSVYVFFPEDWHHIPDRFLTLAADLPRPHPDHLWADDRFVSFIAAGALHAVPRHLAVKFVNEFMAPNAAWAQARGRRTAVRQRRQGLVALTFSGDACKPEDLLALPDGGELRDRKGRVLVWTDEAMSGLIPVIRRHWAHLNKES